MRFTAKYARKCVTLNGCGENYDDASTFAGKKNTCAITYDHTVYICLTTKAIRGFAFESEHSFAI